MSSNTARTIAIMAAVGAVGVATGGFGLAALGAASGATAAGGAAAAATAGASTATAAAATTAATTAGTAATGGFFSSIMASPWTSFGMSLLGAGSSVMQGMEAARAAKAEQRYQTFARENEKIRATATENERLDQLTRVQAAQNATFAGRGVSINTGTARVIADDTNIQSNAMGRINRLNATMAIGERNFMAQQAGREATNARIGGYVKAGEGLMSWGVNKAKIG